MEIESLEEKTIEMMSTNHLPDNKDLTEMSQSAFSETPYQGVGFGLGFSIVLDPNKSQSLTDIGEYGWGGAAEVQLLDKSKRRNGSNIFNSITAFINLSGEERIKISCLFCSYASVKMPLVKPLSPENNSEVKELAKFFNETLGFCPNSVLTMQIRPDIALAFINLNKAVMENKGRVTSSFKKDDRLGKQQCNRM